MSSPTHTALNPDHDSLGPDAAHSSPILLSTVEGPAPNESHQDLTPTADHGTFLQATSDQAADLSPVKPSPPLPEPQASPRSSPTNSEPEQASPDSRTPSLDPQELGVELYSQLPPALQRLLSPLFVEPFPDPFSVPTSYQPRLTSAFFREAFREEYNQYVESKPRDSLPSLFDLEMMAPHQAALKEPIDPAWVTSRLRAYGLFQEDESSMKRYPEVLQAAKAVINKPRDSFPHDEDIELFKAKLETYRNANEDTLLNQVLPFFFKETRWIPACRSEAKDSTVLRNVIIQEPEEHSTTDKSQADLEALARVAALEGSEERVSVSFFRSGMIEITNRDYSRTLPFFNDDALLDKDLNNLMAKDAHLINPRPDRAYGVNPKVITWPDGFILPTNVQLLMEIVRSCFHVFLILEGKSSGGKILEARNQVCRGGAIGINTERHLRKELGMPEKTGPDLETLMFSVVVTDQTLEVWVHWAEVLAPDPKHPEKHLPRPKYHMNCVFVNALAEAGALGRIRRVLHNIMDWGVGERLEKLAPVHEAIVEYADNRSFASGKERKRQKTAR
ncbi:MAG: hypothetical protein Q9212_002668 [Teloschistes hypoglaucus]